MQVRIKKGQLQKKINSALKEIISEVSLTKKEQSKVKKIALSVAGDAFWRSWKSKLRELRSSRKIYQSGMSIERAANGDVFLKLEGEMPNAIESGSGPFDLKPEILANGIPAKVSKDGALYKFVPIGFGTKKTSMTYNKLPSSVYKSLLQNGSTYLSSDIPEKYRGLQSKLVALPSGQPDGATSEVYTHRASIYQGISMRENGKYSSFRTVSSRSPRASWIHPGFKAKNLLGKAQDSVNFEEIVVDVVQEFIDDKIKKAIKNTKKKR